jgi:hypothetical protein
MPGGSWYVGIVLDFDVLVQIPKRLGTKRVSELASSQTVEGVAQVAEDLKILFLQCVELGHLPAELKGGTHGGYLSDPRNADGGSALVLVLLEHRHRYGHDLLLRSTPRRGSLGPSHAPPVLVKRV